MKLLMSTIGLKAQMAISGMVLLGFVVGHMLGNLQIFLGPEALNNYAATLHGTPALIWGTRVTLLLAVAVHIFSAYTLTARSKAARPVGYKDRQWLGASYPARTMRWGGVILLAFIVYHLLHLTVAAPVLPAENLDALSTGEYGPAVPACEHKEVALSVIASNATDTLSNETIATKQVVCDNVYDNVVRGFHFIPVSLFYILAQIMLGMHIAHGLWSATRTLGISSPKWSDNAEKAALALGALITVGNCSIPLAVMIGLL